MLKNKEYKKLYRKYLLNQAIRRQKITRWLDRKSERHIQVMAFMFFMGSGLTIAYGFKTLATWSQISQMYFGLAVIFTFIPMNWLPSLYRIRKEMKLLLAVCAFAPFFTGLLLMLNFYLSTESIQKTVKITQTHVHYSERILIIELDDTKLNRHVEIRKFPLDKNNFEPDSVVYLIHKGFLGINSVHDSWLIRKN